MLYNFYVTKGVEDLRDLIFDCFYKLKESVGLKDQKYDLE